MRGVLLLVVGLAAGLVAGWALFGADGAAGRARHRGTGTEASEHARDDTTGPADTGSVHGAAGAAGEARRSVRSLDPEERIVRSLMREAYDRQSKDGKAPEADIFEAGVGEVLRRSGRYREADTSSTGAALVYREKLRAEAGEIAGSPLVLQICVAGGVTARLTDRGNSDRFEVGAPPAQGANLLHVSGGTVPPGSMFLIERVVLRAYAGSRGRLNVALPEMDRFDWDSGEAGKNTTALELKGLVRLMHGRERDVYVSAFGVAASVEMHGRLVPAAEGESMRARPLVMGDGWLTGEPVLMQVRADHGGGNDRKVYLNGKLYRIDALEPASIWEDAPDFKRTGSFAHYRGCGFVPPGKAFRVTRVEYRARLAKDENSGLSVSVGGTEQVKADSSQGGVVGGAWTGDVLVFPGEEDKVSVTCNKYGLAEITVFGDLVDDPRARK